MALGEGLGRLLPSGVKTAATGAEDASGFARPSATSSAARKSPGANTTTDAPHIAGSAPARIVSTSASAPGEISSMRLNDVTPRWLN